MEQRRCAYDLVMRLGRILKKQNPLPYAMGEQRRLKSVLLVMLLVASPWLLVQGWILVGAPTPSHTSMPSCPDQTMNCASISADASVRMDAGLSTVIEANVSEVWDAWQDWSEANGLRDVHEDVEEGGEHFSHRIAITPFWRFPDDVVVQFTPQGEDTAISLYSASRLGQSDLGVNPERLESLHAALVSVQADS